MYFIMIIVDVFLTFYFRNDPFASRELSKHLHQKVWQFRELFWAIHINHAHGRCVRNVCARIDPFLTVGYETSNDLQRQVQWETLLCIIHCISACTIFNIFSISVFDTLVIEWICNFQNLFSSTHISPLNFLTYLTAIIENIPTWCIFVLCSAKNNSSKKLANPVQRLCVSDFPDWSSSPTGIISTTNALTKVAEIWTP